MSARRSRPKNRRGPLIWPALLVMIGGVLLLSNFLLLGNFDVIGLWPLLLVVLGLQILLRGDLTPDQDQQSFGITRGQVEAATLEIHSGEIDVSMQGLQNQQSERLIAGQFARQSRPVLEGDAQHAHLKLQRWQTPWLSFADWDMGLSSELPWRIVASSYLGQITLDMSDLIIHSAEAHSGVGDLHITLPSESFETIITQSTLGDIHIITPPNCNARIQVRGGRFFSVQCDNNRYTTSESEPNLYLAQSNEDLRPQIRVIVDGTFGNLYLS